MPAQGAITAPRPNPIPNNVPFVKDDPRRSAGGLTKAEREFRAALEAKHIPRASQLLDQVFEMGINGDAKMAELFFKVCGLIKKPTDADKIQEQARALLDAMIGEARARREGP